MTTTPSWLEPVVRTVTMPTFGRERDSRDLEHLGLGVDRVALEDGAGRRTSSQPRLAITFWETSVTLWPVTSASVKVESTSGRPHSVCAA